MPVAGQERGLADVLHLEVPPVELLDFARRDLQGDGHVGEANAEERETSLHGVDRRGPLAVESRIHEHELPHRRGPLGDDAVLAAMDVDVARLISDVFHRGAGRADLKIHVREDAVLRDVETNCDGGGVAVLQFEVDVFIPL